MCHGPMRANERSQSGREINKGLHKKVKLEQKTNRYVLGIEEKKDHSKQKLMTDNSWCGRDRESRRCLRKDKADQAL